MRLLPPINLDDRKFQDLVTEARARIAVRCPEWTDHNVSDPGITLIELFAWMTELTIYRLNRVPDKLHVELLELLGVRLDPPSAARADLRIRLTGAADEVIALKRGATEVGTVRTASEEPIIFQTTDDFTIVPVRPVAYVVERSGQPRDVVVADGVARPHGPDALAFGSPPLPGDALYLGFEESIARLLLRVDVEAVKAAGSGVDPDDPPLEWAASDAGGWSRAEVVTDTTGGLNFGNGSVEVQMPAGSTPELLAQKKLHWLRCRIIEKDGAAYQESPVISSITATTIGALVPVSHSALVEDELLGESDGTPGQRFSFRMRPVLPLADGETLQVRNPGEQEWTAWEPRETLAHSGPDDKHFAIDYVSSRLEFGPAIRETDGSWTQYGAFPPRGAALRFTRYRYGGGRRGNVAAETLTMLKSSVAGIASVVNPRAAAGGVDAESLQTARTRAAMEVRSRFRAVTAEDFEFLARTASPRVARTRCVCRDDDGAVLLYLLPRVEDAERQLTAAELRPDEALYETVRTYLDERRMLGTTVQLLPMALRAISVVVNVQTSPAAEAHRVEEEIARALYTYINPLVGGSALGRGDGWPFGRQLHPGELYSVVHAVAGVELVTILRVYETNLDTGEQSPKPVKTRVQLEPDELLVSGQHIVMATRREP